jgi:hypothetical protein
MAPGKLSGALTMRAEVRNMITRQSILTIEKLVFVNLNAKAYPNLTDTTK